MKTVLRRTQTNFWSRYSQRSLQQANCFSYHTDNNQDEDRTNIHSLLNMGKDKSCSTLNNNNNDNTPTCLDTVSFLRNAAKGAAATATTTSTSTAAAASLVTTAAGYSLTPMSITLISNAPLVAFAFVQASGIGPIRQILADKETKDLSPFPFVSLYTNCGIWTLYGILQSDQTILVANTAGVIAGIIYTGIFAKNTHLSMLKYYGGSIGLLSVMLTSPLWIGSTENAVQLLGSFGCASAIILMASPLSVVNTVLKDKATESMPFMMSLAMTINGTAWGTYGWMVANDPYVWLPNFLGASAGLVQLGLHAKFGIDSKKVE